VNKLVVSPLKSPAEIEIFLENTLWEVQKPGRYTGGELNQVVKDWNKVETRLALVFPDLYDLGMSNLGLAILYDLLNQRHDVLAERAFAPWEDMETALRREGIPLFSLESKHPLFAFDIVGFSLPYEMLYTNTLNLLDLSNIPLLSSERSSDHPLVIAGGHATFNPEPMHAFIDVFVIGEGEEVIQEIVDVHQSWKRRMASRSELLTDLSRLWGVYVPSKYQAHYHPDGVFSHLERLSEISPWPVRKRLVPSLPKPTTRFVVPYIDTVHNRVSIEIMRGCTRGCRFCQAGMVLRPVRERKVAEIMEAIDEALANTGYEEIGLLSLSSSDYSHILPLVEALSEKYNRRHLSISLPSLRIESFSVELMDALRDARRRGFTLAPEAASEHLREMINKPISNQQILDTTRGIFSRGWHNIKLYFMIGHPSETMEDVQAIPDLCKAVLVEGRKVVGKRAQVTAGVSTFIPKSHTPFQWVACNTLEEITQKLDILKHSLRGAGLKLNWNLPEDTMVEAWLSRGDRRMSQVIYQAWKLGVKFDAWTESNPAQERSRYHLWLEAFSQTGLDPAFYLHRQRSTEESFPWDHISTGVRKKHLLEEFQWSQQGRTRPDCRQHCYACGILPVFNDLRQALPRDAWKCPELKSVDSIG
jgi:radical SAM family uncharacterized protein